MTWTERRQLDSLKRLLCSPVRMMINVYADTRRNLVHMSGAFVSSIEICWFRAQTKTYTETNRECEQTTRKKMSKVSYNTRVWPNHWLNDATFVRRIQIKFRFKILSCVVLRAFSSCSWLFVRLAHKKRLARLICQNGMTLK